MNEDFEIDLTPTTWMLQAQMDSTLGWKRSLAELIDNALDAKAASIRITHGSRSLIVEDDGIGCSEADAFFKQGKHRSKHGLGKFGVGLKDAALWLKGTMDVQSVAKDGGVKCSVNWKRLMEGGVWKSRAERLSMTDPTGTRITFSGIDRQWRESSVDELGYIFYPAIESGRQVLVRRGTKRFMPIPAFQFPPLDNVLEHTSDIAGKEFRVRAGIVQDGHDNPYPGFTIAYKHRVITNTLDGCGSFGTARFVGVVQLGEQWKLSRNKDELVEDASLLTETLHLICKDILSDADSKSRIVAMAGIEQTIAANLQGALLAHKKAQRDSTKEKVGTVEPKETGRSHRRANKLQPGDKRLMSKIGSRIMVEFVQGLKEIGRASFNEDGTRISLSLHNPYVEWAKDHVDTNALTALAATILAIEAANVTDDKQRHRLLPEIDDAEVRDRFLAGLSLYTSQMSVNA